MSDITIKIMTTDDETAGKGYVHWKSWHESYSGLVDAGYLDKEVTLEKCVGIARTNKENVLIAKEGERVVGFVAFGKYRGDLEGYGEIYAIYVLEEYKGRGVGHALMTSALERLSEYNKTALWVFKENAGAIAFYRKCGFEPDGAENTFTLGKPMEEIRMVRA